MRHAVGTDTPSKPAAVRSRIAACNDCAGHLSRMTVGRISQRGHLISFFYKFTRRFQIGCYQTINIESFGYVRPDREARALAMQH